MKKRFAAFLAVVCAIVVAVLIVSTPRVRFEQHAAFTYVVDSDGRRNVGFHDYRRLTDGSWTANRGATEWLLDKNFQPVGEAYELGSIAPAGCGTFTATFAGEQYQLNQYGQLSDKDKGVYYEVRNEHPALFPFPRW